MELMALSDFANPSRFLNFANQAIPWLAGATVLAFAFAIDQAMIAPDDYQQGATVKIMFLHVPSAWLGMLGWGVMTVAALGTLVWRQADRRGAAGLAPLVDFDRGSARRRRGNGPLRDWKRKTPRRRDGRRALRPEPAAALRASSKAE